MNFLYGYGIMNVKEKKKRVKRINLFSGDRRLKRTKLVNSSLDKLFGKEKCAKIGWTNL